MKTSKLVATGSVVAELLVAVSVFGVFAGILFPIYNSVRYQANQAAATAVAVRTNASADRHQDRIASARSGE